MLDFNKSWIDHCLNTYFKILVLNERKKVFNDVETYLFSDNFDFFLYAIFTNA